MTEFSLTPAPAPMADSPSASPTPRTLHAVKLAFQSTLPAKAHLLFEAINAVCWKHAAAIERGSSEFLSDMTLTKKQCQALVEVLRDLAGEEPYALIGNTSGRIVLELGAVDETLLPSIAQIMHEGVSKVANIAPEFALERVYLSSETMVLSATTLSPSLPKARRP